MCDIVFCKDYSLGKKSTDNDKLPQFYFYSGKYNQKDHGVKSLINVRYFFGEI